MSAVAIDYIETNSVKYEVADTRKYPRHLISTVSEAPLLTTYVRLLEVTHTLSRTRKKVFTIAITSTIKPSRSFTCVSSSEILKFYTMCKHIEKFLEDLKHEWPEVYRIAEKLKRGEALSKDEELWIREIAEVVGWDDKDVINDLKNVDADPSERVEKYAELFEKYYEEAKKFKKAGDTRQAAEKLWGAITALIKLYAAKKGIPIIHWSRGKMEKFVTNSVKQEYKKLLRDLLDKGHILHEHFYESHLDPKTFEERWEELIQLLEKAKKIVFET